MTRPPRAHSLTLGGPLMQRRKAGNDRFRVESLEGRLAPSDLIHLGGGSAQAQAEFTIIYNTSVVGIVTPEPAVLARVPVEPSSPVFAFVAKPFPGFYR